MEQMQKPAEIRKVIKSRAMTAEALCAFFEIEEKHVQERMFLMPKRAILTYEGVVITRLGDVTYKGVRSNVG